MPTYKWADMDALQQSDRSPPPSQRVLRSAVLMALLLAGRLLVVQHPIPTHGDEVGFIEGLGFPAPYPVHRPGYPLWVGLGGLGTWLGLAPYASFELWSVIGSILAPWVLYRWLATHVADGLAWWMALAFGVNPLIWFLSATALTYTCAIFIAIIVISSCARSVCFDDLRAARRAIIALMICMWIRPDYLLWLSPLVGWMIWQRRGRGLLVELLCLAVGAAGLVAFIYWLYDRQEAAHPRVGDATTWLLSLYNTSTFRLGLVDGLARSLAKYLGILAWVFGPVILLIPFAVGWVVLNPPLLKGITLTRESLLARPPPRIPSRDLGLFFLLWTLPLTVFVLLIHMSEPGHLILLVPAGYVLIALWLEASTRPRYALRIASALALFSAVQFLAYPWSTEVTGWRKTLNAKIAYLSAAGLRQIDHRWDIHTPSDIWPTAMHQPTATRPAFGP